MHAYIYINAYICLCLLLSLFQLLMPTPQCFCTEFYVEICISSHPCPYTDAFLIFLFYHFDFSYLMLLFYPPRFIIVSYKFASPVILINVYVPNYLDCKFFNKLFSTIPSDNDYNLIIGGEFNCVLNTILDRSSNKTQLLTKSAKIIDDFIAWNGVSDIWRFTFNSKRAFSFFSDVHHTYTQINYFFLDNQSINQSLFI